MSLFRWIVGMPMAALVSAGLFIMMAQLIREKEVVTDPPKPSLNLKVTAQETDTDPTEITRKRQEIAEKMPPTEIDFPKQTGRDRNPAPRPEKVDIDKRPPADRNAISPTIRIAPPYPENCRSKGAHGVVVVQFDVTPEGNVVNPRVIQTPDSCFVRPIQKAVSGWKYAPAKGGGMRYGVVETFNFQLTD